MGLDYKGSEDLLIYENLCKVLERILHINKDLDNIIAFPKVLKNERFQDYIMNQNSAIAESQIIALQRVLDCLENHVRTIQSLKIDKDEVYEKCMIDWKLKNFTEEEKREKFESSNYETLPPKFVSIRNERPQDLTPINDIVNRFSGNKDATVLRSSARRKPEDIVPERSLDLQQLVKPEEKKAITDLRFFKPNSKNKSKKK